MALAVGREGGGGGEAGAGAGVAGAPAEEDLVPGGGRLPGDASLPAAGGAKTGTGAGAGAGGAEVPRGVGGGVGSEVAPRGGLVRPTEEAGPLREGGSEGTAPTAGEEPSAGPEGRPGGAMKGLPEEAGGTGPGGDAALGKERERGGCEATRGDGGEARQIADAAPEKAAPAVGDDEEGPDWEPGLEPESSMSSSDSEDYSDDDSSEPFSLSLSESSDWEEEGDETEEGEAGASPGKAPTSLVEGVGAEESGGDGEVFAAGSPAGARDQEDWGNFLTALHEGRLLEESDSDDDIDLDEFLDANIGLGDLVEGPAEPRAVRPLTRAEGPVEDYDLDDYEAALEAAEWELTGNDRKEYADFLADFFALAEADEDSGDELDGDYVAKWGAMQIPELLTPSKRRMPSPRRRAKRNIARPILGNINVAAKAKEVPLKAARVPIQVKKLSGDALNNFRAPAGRALQFVAARQPGAAAPASDVPRSLPQPPVVQTPEKTGPAWTSDELAYLEEQSLPQAYLFSDTFRPKQVEELYWQIQALVQLLLQWCAVPEVTPGVEGEAKKKLSKKAMLAAKKEQAMAEAKAKEEQARRMKLWGHLNDILMYTQWVSMRNTQLHFHGLGPETLGMGIHPKEAAAGQTLLNGTTDPHGSQAWVPWRGRLIHYVQGVTDNTLVRKLHHMVMTRQVDATAMTGVPLDLDVMRFEDDFNPYLMKREMKRLMRNKMQLFTPAEDRLLAIGIRTLGNNYRLIKARLLPGKSAGQINTRRRNVLQRSSNREIKNAMAELHSKLSPELLREIQAALDKYRNLPSSSRWEMVALSPSPLLRGHSAAVLKQMWESMNSLPWNTKHKEEEEASVPQALKGQGAMERLLGGDSDSEADMDPMDPDWGLAVFNNAECIPGGSEGSSQRDTPFEQDEMEESGSESDGGQPPKLLPVKGGEPGSLSTGAGTAAATAVLAAATVPPSPPRSPERGRESYFSQEDLDDVEPAVPGPGKGAGQARPFEVGAAEREELSDSEPEAAEGEPQGGFERELLSDSD